MGSAGSNESALSFYLRAPRVGADPLCLPEQLSLLFSNNQNKNQPTQLVTTFPHSGPSFFPHSFISWKNNGKLYIAKDL